MEDSPAIYDRIIHYDEYKEIQIRLVVNKFRDVEYLQVRKYYMDWDGEWQPSSEGVSMPLDFNNAKELFTGLIEILSLAESKEIIATHFKELINSIYND